ncbi:MAG TPA: divergent polysaccharide deacetylase family protein [Alphaproteobacteria bacterium]|jgi:hypothetical protein
MSEPDFDAPAVGQRPRVRRKPPSRPARAWGLASALLAGLLLLIGAVVVVAWLAGRPVSPREERLAASVDLTPASPAEAPAAPTPGPTPVTPPAAAPAPQAAPPQATPQAAPASPAPPQQAAKPAIPAPQVPSSTTPATRVPMPGPDGLAPVPDAALVERTPDGMLPVIGSDGRKPWQVYARPFDQADKRPRIALIMTGLGQSAAATEAAIQRLPGAVTLAFAVYARNLPQWVDLSRAAGHEVLLTVPMEPVDYPANDPGPYTLLSTLTQAQNRERLTWLLSRFTGYSGVINLMGSRFTTLPDPLKPVLSEINRRGLLFVDSRSSLNSVAAKLAGDIKLPRAINNRFIDTKASRADIDQRLEELEQIARAEGVAVGVGAPYPVTLERVTRWAQELEGKGIVLAPVSAVVDRQPN